MGVKQLGARIRNLRKAIGVTQEELAENSGISAKHLGEIERGKTNLTLDILEKLSIALNIDLPDIMDFQHEKNRKDLIHEIQNLLSKAPLKELKIIFRFVKILLR